MGLIAPLAALLGIEVSSVVERAKATAIVYGVIAAFVLAAVIFLTLAGYLALADLYGAIVAALILGGTFLVLAIAVYLGALIGRGREQKKLAERRRSSETGAFVTTAVITALPMLLRSPLLLRLGIPAAAIAAFAMLKDQSDKD